MEGFSKLGNLTDLVLCSNEITKVDGLVGLSKLTFLSLAKNKIADTDQSLSQPLLGLNLKCLIIADNPFTDGSDYSKKVISALPGLKYLDYKMIDDELRKEAESYGEKNKGKIKEMQKGGADLKSLEKEEILKSAGIAETENLIPLLKQDHDMKELEAFEITKDKFKKCEEEFRDAIVKFQSGMESLNRKRLETQNVFKNMMKVLEKESELQSISKIDDYKRKYKKFEREFKSKKATDTDIKTMLTEIEMLEDTLMEIEVKHSTKLDSMVGKKEEEDGQLKKLMSLEISNLNSELKASEKHYDDELKEGLEKEAAKYQTDAQKEGINSEGLRELIEDSERRSQKFDASKEYRDNKIQLLDDSLIAAMKLNFDSFTESINKESQKRNRAIIQEVIVYIDDCKRNVLKKKPSDQDSDDG